MTIEVDPADMLLFASVVREGGFTAAARRAGISKQAVSIRIARLEEQLGARVLERTTRSLRLTEAGARYYEHCAAIASQITEANDELRGLVTEPVGRLRVSVPVIFGRRHVMPVVSMLATRYPRLVLEVVLADRRVNLVEEGFDLAIRVGELDDSSLVARKIGEGHVRYVASPAFLRKSPLREPSELARTRCIGLASVETWRLGGRSYRIEPAIVVNDLELAHQAALDGLGVARLPSFVYGPDVEARRLRLLFDESTAMRQPLHAVYPSRRHLAPKVTVFLEAIAEHTARVLPFGPRSGRRAP